MVVRIITFHFLFYLLFSSIGCSQEIAEISPTEVKQMLDQEEDVLIIDVRTVPEFSGELGHIPGAILRPVQEIEDWQGEFQENKEDVIILVCRSGNRSGVAAQHFQNHGYRNVYNMAGGMRAWNNLSYDIDRTPAGE